MSHYHLKHKQTGEECFVQSLDGYDRKEWKVTELDREPGHHERLVDGKLTHHAKLEARSSAEARYRNTPKGDLMLLIEDLLSRIQVLESKK